MNVIRNLLTLEIYYETFGTNELVWPILGQCSYFIRPENSKKIMVITKLLIIQVE